MGRRSAALSQDTEELSHSGGRGRNCKDSDSWGRGVLKSPGLGLSLRAETQRGIQQREHYGGEEGLWSQEKCPACLLLLLSEAVVSLNSPSLFPPIPLPDHLPPFLLPPHGRSFLPPLEGAEVPWSPLIYLPRTSCGRLDGVGEEAGLQLGPQKRWADSTLFGAWGRTGLPPVAEALTRTSPEQPQGEEVLEERVFPWDLEERSLDFRPRPLTSSCMASPWVSHITSPSCSFGFFPFCKTGATNSTSVVRIGQSKCRHSSGSFPFTLVGQPVNKCLVGTY